MTHEYASEGFRATLSDGLLAVYSNKDPVLVETKYQGGGCSMQWTGPRDGGALGELARKMAKWPVFAATAAEDDEGWFHCDIDAGFQRWIGMKSKSEVRQALSKCGFEKAEVKAIMSACEAEPWSHCPRQC